MSKLKCVCGIELDSDEITKDNDFQETMNIILEHVDHILKSIKVGD